MTEQAYGRTICPGNQDGDKQQEPERSRIGDMGDVDQYTIGWVCALPKEQAAARAMLDEEFRGVQIRKAASDTNVYTLGSIGGHRIVIACLPKGQLGVVRASKVAASMTSTFGKIRFVLMVGIGGGVPSGPNNVRLGDVVISTPMGNFPGLVQWDFGKTKDGKFERTGSLNNPPTFLLTALSKMESDHEMEGSKIQQNLDMMFKKWPRMKSKYGRSDSLEDILFSTGYNHLGHPANTSLVRDVPEAHEVQQEATSCLYCDITKAKKRDIAEPAVHYGVIASGNQVIKDAAHRDEINNSLDGNVLCIEMEAAGLMNEFPCLVIRGICDYADSHKNKAWQEHAAAVAAALAKELLGYIPPIEVERERSVRGRFPSELHEALRRVGSETAATREDVLRLKMTTNKVENDQILQWLTPVEYGPQQSDSLRRRQPGTGIWFLESKEYLSWLNFQAGVGVQTLFCPGIPGAGKTVLTSVVIDSLTNKFSDDNTVGIAYIFCNHQREHDQKLEILLSSIVKQLARQQANFPSSLKSLFRRHQPHRTKPSSEELCLVLQQVASFFNRIFVLVDALDECHDHTCRSSLISTLFKLPTTAKDSPALNLFATSRLVPEIEKQFEKCSRREIRATKTDIWLYACNHLSLIPVSINDMPDLGLRIIKTVAKAANGMFLLAQLYMDLLKDTTTVAQILSILRDIHKDFYNALDNENTIAHIYNQTYDKAMERIRTQSPKLRELGERVLAWVVHARRPLKSIELRHALAVRTRDSIFDGNKVEDKTLMIEVCAGLVTVENGTDIIRLVHHTTATYFQSRKNDLFPQFHSTILDVCIKHLYLVYDSYRSWKKSRERMPPPVPDRLSAFLSYPVEEWGYHATQTLTLSKYAEDFFLDSNMPEMLSHLSRYNTKQVLQKRKQLQHRYGSWEDTSIESSESTEVDESMEYDESFESALILAARLGISQAVKLCHEHGADINQADRLGRTPLLSAVRRGDANIALLLLELHADPNKGAQQTPLHAAISRKGIPIIIMEALLDHGGKVGGEDAELQTPMLIAVEHLNSEAIMSLVRRGASIHEEAPGGQSLLQIALRPRLITTKIARELGYKQRYSLHSVSPGGQATFYEHLHERNFEVAKTLLDLGVCIDLKGEDGRVLLRTAALHVQIRHRELWLFGFIFVSPGDVDANAYQTKRWRESPNFRFNEFVECFFKKYRAYFKHSSLLHNRSNVQLKFVEFLLENGVSVHGKDAYDQTPLFAAVIGRNVNVMQCFLDWGANADAEDANGVTPLKVAIYNYIFAGENFLDERIARATKKKASNGRKPLVPANPWAWREVIGMLLKRDVNVARKNIESLRFLDLDIGLLHHILINGNTSIDDDIFNGQNALSRFSGQGYLSLVRLLIDEGAKVDAAQGQAGYTPFMTALSHGHNHTADFLLQKGANINQKDSMGQTALIAAALYGRTDAVKWLIWRGADVNAKDHQGRSAWSNACWQNDYNTVIALFQSLADYRNTDKYGQTLLFEACEGDINNTRASRAKYSNKRTEQNDIIELLLGLGLDIEATDTWGRTPLIHTCFTSMRESSYSTVGLLIKKGANVRARDIDGLTACDYASRHGHNDVVRMLRSSF